MKCITKTARIIESASSEQARRGVHRHRVWRLALILGLSLLVAQTAMAAQDYAEVVRSHLALEAEALAEKLAELEERDPALAELNRGLMEEIELLPLNGETAPAPAKAEDGRLLAFASPLATLLAIGGIGYLLKRRLDRQAAGTSAEERIASLLAENPSSPESLNEFREALEKPASVRSLGSEAGADGPGSSTDAVEEFLAGAPRLYSILRSLLSEIHRNADEAARMESVRRFHDEASRLKRDLRAPQMRPVWLLTSALEGLLKQLSRSPAEVTPSVIQTIAGAVDILEALSVRGTKSDLATEPPVKLLAVDDDAVSRLAISFALKQAFKAPDLAPDADAALELVENEAYDVIFLDVDMPGMDGYELCKKIRQTAHHGNTPIVFVTRHTDFGSRAKSTMSGGDGVIGKPFLTFEITVKALTLALRNRIKRLARIKKGDTDKQEAGTQLQALAVTKPGVAPGKTTRAQNEAGAGNPAAQEKASRSDLPQATKDGSTLIKPVISSPSPTSVSTPTPSASSCEQRPFEPANELFSRASSQLDPIRDAVRAMSRAEDDSACIERLEDIYLRLHSLTPDTGIPAPVPPIHRLTVSLSGLVKKLLERAENRTPSTYSTLGNAVELLHDLCVSDARCELPAGRKVRMLVVDDDPISRRAMACALQMAFDKPDCVEDGEAALAAAEQQTYDVIFLDVQMPGMDGFEVCSKLRQSGRNAGTPVVFVTSHGDAQARAQAIVCGGNDFIQKPFLTAEITVKALTFALRARLPEPQNA